MPRRSIAGLVPEESVDAMPSALRQRCPPSKRSWDKANPLTAYRGIPPERQARLLEIAKAQAVPVGDGARRFLEAGLSLHDGGQLALAPVPRAVKQTLYPGENAHKAT